jgi:hypothetical protein
VAARVKVDAKDAQVFKVSLDGKPVMEFQGRLAPRPGVPGNVLRTGYIHPLFSPSGAQLTDAIPEDQPRHLGIWSFWKQIQVKKQTVDFWDKVGTSGTIQLESMGPKWDGPVHGGFEARQIATGIQGFGGLTLLRDQWRVLVYALPGSRSNYFLFDLETEQAVAGQDVVTVPKADSGGVAVRGRAGWKAATGGVVKMSSEGAAEASHARWAYIGGLEKGKGVGVAVLGHPANFGAPQGLGNQKQGPLINLSPNVGQNVSIEPYRPLRQVYRFVALDGKPDAKLLSRLWNDFALPPQTSVRAATAENRTAKARTLPQ